MGFVNQIRRKRVVKKGVEGLNNQSSLSKEIFDYFQSLDDHSWKLELVMDGHSLFFIKANKKKFEIQIKLSENNINITLIIKDKRKFHYVIHPIYKIKTRKINVTQNNKQKIKDHRSFTLQKNALLYIKALVFCIKKTPNHPYFTY